jgi:hypothetical protein
MELVSFKPGSVFVAVRLDRSEHIALVHRLMLEEEAVAEMNWNGHALTPHQKRLIVSELVSLSMILTEAGHEIEETFTHRFEVYNLYGSSI